MKKTGKLILSIFLVIFSLTGCPSPNTTKEPENQPEQNNQEENEQIENTQKMEIKINEFSIWPSEKVLTIKKQDSLKCKANGREQNFLQIILKQKENISALNIQC